MRTAIAGLFVLALALPGLTLTTAAPRSAAPDGGSDVSGTVTYKGDKIKTKKIKMDADPYCQSAHAETVLSDEIVVGDNGGVQWAFVYVKSDSLKSDPPKEPAKIDQTGCMYAPHVLGVVAGQTLKVVNSDATNHNIHALPKINPDFNFSQKDKGMENEKIFSSPEMAVKVKCDVHPWMGGWVHVLPHGYFAVTGKDGSFTIKGLPKGKYTIEIWHEALDGAKSVEVEVDGSAAKTGVNFEYSKKK